MAEFKSRLHVEVLDASGMFQLCDPLIYYSDILQRDIVVPKGFETDFASIPWFLHSVVQVNGKHRRAAVVHDYLCVHKHAEGIDQRCADEIFREAMRVLDVRWSQRRVMYKAVRWYQSLTAFFKRS
jgi:hypothetical protein